MNIRRAILSTAIIVFLFPNLLLQGATAKYSIAVLKSLGRSDTGAPLFAFGYDINIKGWAVGSSFKQVWRRGTRTNLEVAVLWNGSERTTDRNRTDRHPCYTFC